MKDSIEDINTSSQGRAFCVRVSGFCHVKKSLAIDVMTRLRSSFPARIPSCVVFRTSIVSK